MKKLLLLLFCLTLGMGCGAETHRALVFGLGKQADPMWGRIHGDNDVIFVVQLLQQMGYTDIETLKNEAATKQAMTEAFQALADRCEKGDKVYVHYSGHGQLMTDLDGDEALKWENSHAQWDESWIPYDAYMVYGPEDRGEKHLCDDEVSEFLDKIRTKIGKRGELVVVVDACHSGDATCGPDEEECVRGVDMKFCIPRRIDEEMPVLREEDWLTISACKPHELSTEIKELKVGKLSYALYKIGTDLFEQDKQGMEQTLRTFLEQYQGRIRQNPVVSGKK